jgi:hypothetical protein
MGIIAVMTLALRGPYIKQKTQQAAHPAPGKNSPQFGFLGNQVIPPTLMAFMSGRMRSEKQIVASQNQLGGQRERSARRRHEPARDSKGELLGNRLLAGFFVIALLLGVAFGRGYIVGRNSMPPPKRRPAVPASHMAQPQAGTYWQVAAIAQPQAELFAKVLRDKGFRVLLSPGTKGLTRVLVGPHPDGESLARTKSNLEGSGLQHFILKRE